MSTNNHTCLRRPWFDIKCDIWGESLALNQLLVLTENNFNLARIQFLVSKTESDLPSSVASVWLIVNSQSNFVGFQKFQNRDVFQDILSNFDVSLVIGT